MEHLIKSLRTAFLTILLAAPALAAPPQKVNFQGRLTDLSDNPLNGAYDVTFALYAVPTGGTALWSETQTGLLVDNGALEAVLGSVTPIPYSVARSSAAFLQIQVGAETLTPRQPFSSVLYSMDSAQLAGLSYDAFVDTFSVQSVGGLKTFASISVSSSVTAARFYGDGSGLTGISGDNLGSHTATTDLNMAGRSVLNVGTVTAGAFVGNGSGLTGISGDNLGSHTATQALNMANFGINNVSSMAVGGVSANSVTAGYFYGNGAGLTGISGDNLGSHIAGTALDMANFPVNNVSTLTAGGVSANNVTAGYFYGNGSGLTGVFGTATQALNMAGYPVSNVSSLTVTNSVSAANFYGDGSGLTGISGDNLGSHIAGTALDMAGYQIVNVSSMMVSGPVQASMFIGDGSSLANIPGDNMGNQTATKNLDMAGYGIVSVSSMYVTGIVNAGGFTGDGSGLTNVSAAGDNLGSHLATQNLNMAGNAIWNAGNVSITGQDFSVNGSTLVVTGGKMGIGIATPGLNATASYGRMLHIYDDTPGVYPGIFIDDNDTAPGARWFVHAHGDGRNSFAVRDDRNAYEPLYIEGADVGIGTGDYTPGARLHVISTYTAVAGSILQVSTGMPFAPTAVLTVRNDGNVGIGVPAPSSRLQVAGTVTAVNFVGNGSGLTGISGDNLGSHIAGTALDMTNHQIINVSSLTATTVAAGNFSGNGAGLSNVVASAIAASGVQPGALGASVIASSVAVNSVMDSAVTSLSASKLSGALPALDGSALLNLPGDNLGNHAATKALNMANRALDSVSSMSLTGYGLSGVSPVIIVPVSSFSVLANGNLGVGATAPIDLIHMHGGNPWLRISDSDGTKDASIGMANNVLRFDEAGVGNRMALDLDTSRLGIGTLTPGYKLDVQGGSINASGGLCIGGTCKSSWAEVIAGSGDNLGNHVATTTLNMANFPLINISSIIVSNGGVRIASTTAVTASGLYITDRGNMFTMGYGYGTYLAGAKGTGSVDLQTRRMLSIDDVAGGNYSTITGGESNKILPAADHAFIGAGDRNSVSSGQNGVVTGGYLNALSGSHGFIGGGYQNAVSGAYAAIPGGQYNSAGSNMSLVSGGYTNTIDAFSTAATVLGGSNNAVTYGNYALAAGYFARSNAAGAFTWADSQGQPLDNNVADRTVFKNRGGFMVTGSTSTVLGGTLNRGVFITGDGLVGVSTGAPGAALDVVSGPGAYAQIWRDQNGVVIASMTSGGLMTTQIPGGGDNLGSHSATGPLAMNGYPVNSVSSINGVSAIALNAGGIGPLSLLAGNTLSSGQTGGSVTIAAGGGYNAVGASVTISAGLTSTWSAAGSSAAVVLSGGPSDSPASGGMVKVFGKVSSGGGSPNNPGGPIELIGGVGSSAKGGNIILMPGPGTPEGYVGIGTTNPQAKLHVNGSLELGRFDSSGVSGYLNFLYSGSPKGNIGYTGNMSFFSSPSPAIIGAMIMQANDGIQLGVGSEATLNISSINLVGIGVSNPMAKLEVQAAGSAPSDMAQVWRDAGGTIVSSLSATGVLTAKRFLTSMGAGAGQTSPIGLAGVNLNTQATTGLTEEVLLAYTLPANSLSENNKGIRIKAWGTRGFNTNVSTLTVRLGGISGPIVVTQQLNSNTYLWEVEALVFRTNVNTQKVFAHVMEKETGVSLRGDIKTINANETVPLDVALTGETPIQAGDLVAEGLMVEFLN